MPINPVYSVDDSRWIREPILIKAVNQHNNLNSGIELWTEKGDSIIASKPQMREVVMVLLNLVPATAVWIDSLKDEIKTMETKFRAN